VEAARIGEVLEPGGIKVARIQIRRTSCIRGADYCGCDHEDRWLSKGKIMI
jgi:hypothetical protein